MIVGGLLKEVVFLEALGKLIPNSENYGYNTQFFHTEVRDLQECHGFSL